MGKQRLGLLLVAALVLPQFATTRVVLADGACCHGDGTCEVIPQAYCDGPCDRYLGDGTDCSNPCIVEVPAPCCQPDGSCYVTNPCLCRAAGGDPQSPFESCTTVDCPPKGACCRIDGTCDITTEADCQSPCERYRGDGSTCNSGVLCPIQVPAPCCFNDGSCLMLMPCLCLDQGGDPKSPFQTCATVDCPPKGACCRIDGSCDVTTEDDCQGPCEIYGGDGTACDHLHLCPIQLSAPCCFDDGSCQFIKPCLCLDQGGDPHSPLDTCATVDCTPTGACCRIDGSCDVTTEADCQGPCETYQGNGTDCSGIFCPLQLPRPCCFNDGSCQVIQPCECLALGGETQPGPQTCEGVDCPPKGACCRIDGSCDVTTEDDCQGPCEIYGGDGTACDHLHLCPIQLSAPCCFDDGSCQFIKPCLCLDQGGDPHSPFQTCATVDCPPKGGCCRIDGTCDITTEADCQGPCEHYRGDGTKCKGLCPIQVSAPCCFYDGSCLLLQPCQCTALGGDPQSPFQTCASADCPKPGACCHGDGSCEVLQEADCNGPCDRYLGDGTDCSGVCIVQVPAPCCLPGGSCYVTNPCLCRAAGGTPQSPFQTCATVNCP